MEGTTLLWCVQIQVQVLQEHLPGELGRVGAAGGAGVAGGAGGAGGAEGAEFEEAFLAVLDFKSMLKSLP